MSVPRAAAIPVERIEAPILLLSGDFDDLWPSTLGGEQVIKRLRANDFPYKAEHIAYPGAGHMPGFALPILCSRWLRWKARSRMRLRPSLSFFAGNDRQSRKVVVDGIDNILVHWQVRFLGLPTLHEQGDRFRYRINDQFARQGGFRR